MDQLAIISAELEEKEEEVRRVVPAGHRAPGQRGDTMPWTCPRSTSITRAMRCCCCCTRRRGTTALPRSRGGRGRGGGGATGEGDRACDACDMAVADADDDASEASTGDKGRQHAGVGGSVDEECDEPCDDGCLLLLLE